MAQLAEKLEVWLAVTGERSNIQNPPFILA